MDSGNLHAHTPLSSVGLSVRVASACARLGCKTLGDLANILQVNGPDIVLGMRNCGRKTLSELLSVVAPLLDFQSGARFNPTSDTVSVYQQALDYEKLTPAQSP
jgi:hypothetical protein